MRGTGQTRGIGRRWLWLSLVSLVFSISPGATAHAAAPGFFASLDQSLSTMAPASNLLVAEFNGNSCATIHGRNQDQALAIASTFKLYVLGELARQIQLGTATWDEKITLQSDLRSMPSGDYAYAAAGTTATILQLAQAMI